MESLHGVSQHMISKLQEAGVQSISGLMTTMMAELLEDYYSNHDEDTKGIDEDTISHLIFRAKQKLIERSSLQGVFYRRRHI